MATYAIVKTGGKQYKVAVGDLVKVEKIEVPADPEARDEDDRRSRNRAKAEAASTDDD